MSNEIKNNINDALYNFYMEADKGLINDSLISDVQNLDEYNKKKKQIIFLAKAKAQQKHNDYLKELVNRFKDAIHSNLEKPITVLKEIIQDKPAFALYHNLDKLSNEDIIEIIKDKNLIELLELLEENDKSN